MTTTIAAESNTDHCTDPVIRNQWHALLALNEIPRGKVIHTKLLGEPISYWLDEQRKPHVHSHSQSEATPLPTREHYGYLWTTTGEPSGDVFAIPEALEDDRRTFNAVTVGIESSAPRAVENFLDMAHFPYVHTGLLGDEPHTEVPAYHVQEQSGELWATECRFFQPQAAAASTEAVMVDYIYRVPHPYCAMLYKSSPGDLTRLDAIGIFIHPVTETRINAHLFSSLLDDVSTMSELRRFQQSVLSQDKPILENQNPKRLPLDPRAETPIRADRAAIAYRRWLSQLGVTYGVIPV